MQHIRKSPADICRAEFCGDKEIRTLDPLLAKQVLYQLSYTPIGTAKVESFFIIPKKISKNKTQRGEGAIVEKSFKFVDN